MRASAVRMKPRPWQRGQTLRAPPGSVTQPISVPSGGCAVLPGSCASGPCMVRRSLTCAGLVAEKPHASAVCNAHCLSTVPVLQAHIKQGPAKLKLRIPQPALYSLPMGTRSAPRQRAPERWACAGWPRQHCQERPRAERLQPGPAAAGRCRLPGALDLQSSNARERSLRGLPKLCERPQRPCWTARSSASCRCQARWHALPAHLPPRALPVNSLPPLQRT